MQALTKSALTKSTSTAALFAPWAPPSCPSPWSGRGRSAATWKVSPSSTSFPH